MDKRVLLIVMLLVGGCLSDTRWSPKPASKFDRSSPAFQDLLSRIILAQVMEYEWQKYQMWAAQQGYDVATNGTDFHRQPSETLGERLKRLKREVREWHPELFKDSDVNE